MTDHTFAPAAPDEPVVYGAARPGWPDPHPDRATVERWIAHARREGIERVCCLLPEGSDGEGLDRYDGLDHHDGLLAAYGEAFGADRVCHAPIPDFEFADEGVLYGTVLPFLRAARDAEEPVVVHCSAGSGRTGHVLVAWLVCERGCPLAAALEVVGRRRDPTEAGSLGELRELLGECL